MRVTHRLLVRRIAFGRGGGAGAAAVILVGAIASAPVRAAPFFFTTGLPDGKIATASRPASAGKVETESADDFILAQDTRIDSATFTGLIPLGFNPGNIGNVRVEIYRVFPNDSTDPPSGNVPTRANSPSDVAFAERDVAASSLAFTTTLLSPSFTANNSVVNGIHPFPNQTTGGEGAVTGQEFLFTVTLSQPLFLPADHYFFVPQVELSGQGDFLWLSAPRPTTPPFAPDLQSWIRNENLAPDWLRIGADVAGGANAFNASFSLTGEAGVTLPGGGGGGTVPLPPAAWTGILGALVTAAMRKRVTRVE